MKKILRVFTERTSMTPVDDMVIVGPPKLPIFMPEANEVHISVCSPGIKNVPNNSSISMKIIMIMLKLGDPHMVQNRINLLQECI